jgi:1-phosphofructokinase
MIYTITFNPSIDYIMSVDNFTTGKVNRSTEELVLPGGKGVNVSMVLNNLGHENVALGFTGGFTGEEVKKCLQEKGAHTDFIEVDGLTRINVKLRSDEESEINGRGPEIGEAKTLELMEKLRTLKDGDILVLAGSIPDTMPDSIYMDIMKELQDKDLKIVVDATKDLLLNVVPYKPFMIKPNNHELGEMFGVELKSDEEIIEYAGKLKDMGARNVLISMAGDGAILLAEDGKAYKSAAPKGVLKNSVGAGDSMVAGFISGYIEKGNYVDAFKMGVCTGSASAFSDYLATRDAVEQLLANLEITEL